MEEITEDNVDFYLDKLYDIDQGFIEETEEGEYIDLSNSIQNYLDSLIKLDIERYEGN